MTIGHCKHCLRVSQLAEVTGEYEILPATRYGSASTQPEGVCTGCEGLSTKQRYRRYCEYMREEGIPPVSWTDYVQSRQVQKPISVFTQTGGQ